MKPRLFFFNDKNEISGILLRDLNDLNENKINYEESRIYLHIGFNPPDTLQVIELLSTLPVGIYCSFAFKDGNPGEDWQFTKAIGMAPGDLGTIFVKSSSLSNYKVSPIQLALVEQLVKEQRQTTSVGAEDGSMAQPDELLANFEFSVRTKNVLHKHEVLYISDLVSYNEAALLRLQNFGRKSLREIKGFLSDRGLKLGAKVEFQEKKIRELHQQIEAAPPLQQATLVTKNIPTTTLIADIDSEFERAKLTSKQVAILRHRSGLLKKSTLNELGNYYEVTRERIRQIEQKSFTKILNKPDNKLVLWYVVMSKLCDEHSSIKLNDIHEYNLGLNNTEKEKSFISYLIKCVNSWRPQQMHLRISIIEFKGIQYITRLELEEIIALEKYVYETVCDAGKMPLNQLKEKAEQYVTHKQKSFFDEFWAQTLTDSLIQTDEMGQQIFIKYVKKSTIERGVQMLIEFLNNSEVPITREKLEEEFSKFDLPITIGSVFNQLSKSKEVFPLQHGLWGALKHIEFGEIEKDFIVEAAESIMNSSSSMQFHTREIKQKLDQFLISELNDFAIAAILQKFGKFNYLGRCVFTDKNAGVERRTFIHDVMVKVLRVENRPMHISDLKTEVSKYVSVSDTTQLVTKSPIINLGKNTFALEFWDAETLGPHSSSIYSSLTISQKDVLNYLSDNIFFGEAVNKEVVVAASAAQLLSIANPHSQRDAAKRILTELVKLEFLNEEIDTYSLNLEHWKYTKQY